MAFDAVLFYLFGALAVGASLLVIGQRNPIYSVLLLIASFAALAGLYVLLDAPFAAVTQMIVYAGAIMVLFLFVVMLLNVPREDAAEWDRSHPLNRPGAMRFGAVLAGLLLLELSWAVWHVSTRQPMALSETSPARWLGCRDRPLNLHRLRLPVRSHLGVDPRRHGRRRDSRATRPGPGVAP